MIKLHEDENRSLAWELTKDQNATVRLMMKVLAIVVIVSGITVAVTTGLFLRYLSQYDFESTVYEQSHTVKAVSDNGGNANAVLNDKGEVLINGDGNS